MALAGRALRLHAPELPPASSHARGRFPARGCGWGRRSPPRDRARVCVSRNILQRAARLRQRERVGGKPRPRGGLGGRCDFGCSRWLVSAPPPMDVWRRATRSGFHQVSAPTTAYSSLLAWCTYCAFLAVSAPLPFIYGFSGQCPAARGWLTANRDGRAHQPGEGAPGPGCNLACARSSRTGAQCPGCRCGPGRPTAGWFAHLR